MHVKNFPHHETPFSNASHVGEKSNYALGAIIIII